MIVCTLENISIAEDNALRSWLRKGEFEILMKVLAAKVKSLQVQGLNALLEADSQNEKGEQAKFFFEQANYADNCLGGLRAIAAQMEHYQTAKLT